MQRKGLLAGGNWIVDRVKTIDTWPPQDALASILSEYKGNGGSPYNILKDLSRLGARFPLEAVGIIGDDADGEHILRDCEGHGILTDRLLRTRAVGTSYTDVMTDKTTGRRTFFHYRGANAELSPDHFGFHNTQARLFHLGYLLLLDRLDALDESGLPRAVDVLRRARLAGLQTSLDCVSEPGSRLGRIVPPVLPYVDVLFANDFEAEALTGLTLRFGQKLNLATVSEAARRLNSLGVRRWTVLHFPEGALACSADGVCHMQGSVRMPLAAIAGTAGAGDAFASGVLLGLHEDWTMERCLKLGVCAAAACLRHPTCSDSLVAAEDCLLLGDKYGYRAVEN